MCSGFANMELKGLRCRKLFSSSIYILPAINGSVRSCSCFYINHCLRKFTNGVCQKILAPPTLKNNREPWAAWCSHWQLREIIHYPLALKDAQMDSLIPLVNFISYLGFNLIVNEMIEWRIDNKSVEFIWCYSWRACIYSLIVTINERNVFFVFLHYFNRLICMIWQYNYQVLFFLVSGSWSSHLFIFLLFCYLDDLSLLFVNLVFFTGYRSEFRL
jgi:hypothetical protein